MDVATMTPIAAAAKATPAGLQGAGATLASLIVKEAQTEGNRQSKKADSLKTRLAALENLSADDLLAFKAQLKQDREKMTDDCGKDKAYAKVTDKINANVGFAYVYMAVSVWSALADAFAVGWRVEDYSRPWPALVKSARDWRDEAKDSEGKAKRQQEADKIAAMSPEERVKHEAAQADKIKKANTEKFQDFVKTLVHTGDDGKVLPKGVTKPVDLAAAVETLMLGATREQVAEIAAVVQRKMDSFTVKVAPEPKPDAPQRKRKGRKTEAATGE